MEAATIKCPRCNVDLFSGRAPDVTMHACGRCGGVWLDNENTGVALKQGLSAHAKDLLAKVATNATTDVDKSAPIACPVCANALMRVNKDNIEVDICGQHGTWFDRTELYRLGGSMAPAPPRPVPPAMPPMQYAPSSYDAGGGTSGLAIAGFICSFFCSPLGFILSLMAYNQINRSGNRIGGKGLAVAGVIISVLGFVFGIIRVLASSGSRY
jgi:Zn-finger nucleic acid-binding protein